MNVAACNRSVYQEREWGGSEREREGERCGLTEYAPAEPLPPRDINFSFAVAFQRTVFLVDSLFSAPNLDERYRF